MMTFVKITGAFILAIIIVVVVVIAVVRWKFRSFMKRLATAAEVESNGAVPPFRITLSTMEDDEDSWYHSEDMQRLTADFEELNFTAIGDYEAEGLPLQVRGFQHQEHMAYGVIYDHASVGCWSDVVRRYADESTWTVSSGKQHGMDSAPWHHPYFLPGQPVSELLDELLKTSPKEGFQKVGADQFVQRFSAAYAREMNWRIERGGPTEEEIRRIASKDGQECTSEQIDLIQNQWRTAIGDFLSDITLKAWRKDNKMSAVDFDRISHRLMVVHNRLQPQQLIDIFYEFEDDEDEDEEFDDEDDDEFTSRTKEQLNRVREMIHDSSVIAAFQELLKQHNVQNVWKKIADIKKPLKAEIWERPEDDFNDSDDDDDTHDEYDDQLNV